MAIINRARVSRPSLFTSMALLALACSSCGKDTRQQVYPVQGKVLFHGKPAADAVVVFHPAAGVFSAKGVILPQGTVEADGSFRLTTYEEGDGAPAGEYFVSVMWRRVGAARDEELQEILPSRYLNPATSGLKAQVQIGATQLEPFQLTNAGAAGAGSGGYDRNGR